MGGVVKAVTNVVKSVVKAVVNVVKSVVNFVGDVIGFVFNPFGAFDTPQVQDPGQEAQGVQVTKGGTNNPIPLIYGYRRTGGLIIFAESNGESNRYLYVIYAICEGEIEGVHRVIVNDVELPTVGTKHNAGQIYEPSDGRFKGRMQYQIFNGTESQGQSSLANQTPTWPTKQRKLPGVAYAVFRFEWKEIKTQEDADNNPYSGGIPNVKFDVYGKKIYDVRTHGSGKDLSGSYASRTKAYNFNPANCLLDYLENTRYGAGLPASQIDAETFKIAANKYEQTVNYSNTQTGRALTMNAVINTQAKVLDNIKTITAGCRGIMPFVQGRYKLKVEDGGNATDISSTTINIAYDVDSSNIIGGISLDGERKSSKYNQVIVNYIDPDLEFTNQQVVYNVSGDQTIDNEEELTGEFTFHTVTNPAIARDLAQMIYDKSRVQKTISFTGTQELLDVEVGDIIRITDTVLDLNLDTFRVVGMKLRNDGNLDIEAVEHDATLYPFTSGAQIEIPPPLFIPDDYTIIPYVRPLPTNPVSIVPPLDPDADKDSAGDPVDPVEVNPPAESPDQTVEVKGITSFENFNKSYTALNTWQGTLADGTVYHLGYTTPPLNNFGFEAGGETSLAQYTTTDFGNIPAAQRFQTLYKMAYQKTVAGFTDRFMINLLCPLDTRIDEIRFTGYIQGQKLFERIIDIRANSGGGLIFSLDGNTTTRKDEYTGLTLRKPIELPMDEITNFGNYKTEMEVKWRNKRTGEEWDDVSDFSNVSFPNYSYNLNGKTQSKNNLEAFINYLVAYYYDYKKQQTGAGSESKSFSANLSG